MRKKIIVTIVIAILCALLYPSSIVRAYTQTVYGLISTKFDYLMPVGKKLEKWGSATPDGMEITQISHMGGAIDIRVMFNDKYPSILLAMKSGKVIYSGDFGSGFGNTVCVQTKWKEVYCLSHNSKNTVTEGQQVSKGDVIGIGGNTGVGTGYHCHIQIWKQDDFGEWRQMNVSNTIFGKEISLGWHSVEKKLNKQIEDLYLTK